MTLRIHRSFIAAISALAIAITGFSAAPARAGDDDVAKALAVILGLAVVGTVINKRNDDKKARQQVHTQHQSHKSHKVHKPRHDYVKPRPLPRKVDRRLLPQHCLYNLRTDRGHPIQAFGHNCLSRSYSFTNSLPNHCAQRVQTRHGYGYAYGAHCLSKQGYQLARH